MLADPGIGREDAPLGSVAWAQRVRLHSQHIIEYAVKAPKEANEFVTFFVQHRTWTLLNKSDGSMFSTFEEFCEARKPYGWGIKYVELRRVLELALARDGVNGEKALAVATVAPANPHRLDGPTPKRGVEERQDGQGVLASNSPTRAADDKRAQRLRAIAERTPEAARDLFRRDLLGVVEAAALGKLEAQPGSSTYDPVAGERVHAATTAAVAVVAAAPAPNTPTEKRQLQRKVNAAVREKLDAGKPVKPRAPEVAAVAQQVEGALREIGELSNYVRVASERGDLSAARVLEALDAAARTLTPAIAHLRDAAHRWTR
jgi:hypothetical protein